MIKGIMDDPAQTSQNAGLSTDNPSPAVGKEIEGGITFGEPFPLHEVGTHEVDLPKEVVSAGVSTQPTNVILPQAVQKLGVRPTGQAPSGAPPAGAVSIPLTDDQIAQGLKLGITSSWRWLAEWCVRKIKQVHTRLSGHHA